MVQTRLRLEPVQEAYHLLMVEVEAMLVLSQVSIHNDCSMHVQ